MGEPRYLKTNCTVCDGHIEFPYGALGAEITCPHCGGKTVLTESAVRPATPPPLPKRNDKGATGKRVAVLVMVVLLACGGVIAFLMVSSKKGGSDASGASATPNPGSPSVSSTTTPENASPAGEAAADKGAGRKDQDKSRSKNKDAGKLTEGLEVTKFEIQKAPKGNVVYVVGRVVNHDPAQYFKLKVEFNLFKKGMPAGQCSDRLPNLAPKGTWDFRALILEDGVDEARLSTIEGEKE